MKKLTRDKFISFYYETAKEFPEIKLDPKKAALLIVDLQNEFVLRDFGEALEFKKDGRMGQVDSFPRQTRQHCDSE